MDITRDPNYPDVPELDKFVEFIDEYNAIAKFLDWAAEEKMMHIANAPKMICEYLGVDWEVMEEERAAVLEFMHNQYPSGGASLSMTYEVDGEKEVIDGE